MIRLYDKDYKILKYISEDAITSLHQTERLTEERYISDFLDVQMNILDDETFNQIEYITIPVRKHDTLHHFFWVQEKTSDNDFTRLVGVQEGIEELSKTPVIDVRPQNRTMREASEQVLAETNYIVRYAANTGRKSSNAYFTDVWTALKEYCRVWKVEMRLFVEVTDTGIGARYIDFREQIGKNNGARVVYGHNALQVIKEETKHELYTALIGRGNGEQLTDVEDIEDEIESAYGRKINFKDIEWKKSNGDPLDKPLGQYYLELPEATEKFGIKYNGEMKPKIGFLDVDSDDIDEVIYETYETLLNVSRPQVMLKASSSYLQGEIGDVVRVVRKDKQIDYDTRIFEIIWDRLNDNAVDIKLDRKSVV